MKQNRHILCVDDNEDNIEILKLFFTQEGYQVTTSTSAEECLERLQNEEFSAIVLDYHLPNKDGIVVFNEIRSLNLQIPVVFYTADAREKSRQRALEAGVEAYLVKPKDIENVVPIVSNLIEANSEKTD